MPPAGPPSRSWDALFRGGEISEPLSAVGLPSLVDELKPHEQAPNSDIVGHEGIGAVGSAADLDEVFAVYWTGLQLDEVGPIGQELRRQEDERSRRLFAGSCDPVLFDEPVELAHRELEVGAGVEAFDVGAKVGV